MLGDMISIWDMGYRIWDMGYGIWDMGYVIWDMGQAMESILCQLIITR